MQQECSKTSWFVFFFFLLIPLSETKVREMMTDDDKGA